MSDNLAALAGVADELAFGPDLEGEILRKAAFDRWVKHHAPDDPMGERVLLGYLLAHPDWAPVTAAGAVSAIDRCARRSNESSPASELVRRYLRRLRQEKGDIAIPLVPALRVEDAVKVAQALDERATTPARYAEAVGALRDGLMVIRRVAPRTATIQVAMMSMASLRLGQANNSPVLLIPSCEAPLFELTDDGAQRWQDNLKLLTNRNKLRRRVNNALARAGIASETTVEHLSRDQWAQLWLLLDPNRPRVIRDRAYMLVAFAHARRHAEMRRLDIQDVQETSSGYRVTYRHTKNGDDYIGIIEHAEPGDGTCPPHCAACAVEELLDWERHCMHRTTGPLIATRYAGEVRRMTRQNGRFRVRALTGLISATPWGSTRSLRAGAATSAYEAGFTLEEIANLTGHRCLAQAHLYIRSNALPDTTLQVTLDRLPT